MNTFLERLKDPGSIRSLVLALFMFKGLTVDDAMINMIVDGVLGVIGTISFFMTPKVAAVAAITAKVDQAAAVVQTAAADAAKTSATLRNVLGSNQ